MNSSIVLEWLNSALEEEGFVRVRKSWYRDSAETIAVVNLDKSPYGGQFYVNLAASAKALAASSRPAEHHCHFRVRLDALSPDRATIAEALDLERPMPQQDRQALIAAAISDLALPLLKECETVGGIARIISQHPRASQFAVLRTLREYLAANSTEGAA
jgi:hypothetical protein